MIIPTADTQRVFRPNPVVPIELYARYLGYDECSALGVRNGPNATNFECSDIWTLDQRNYFSHYLSEAQQEIEDEIGYFLNADWVVGDIQSERDSLYRYVDQQKPAWGVQRRHYKSLGTYKSRWKKINAVGTRAESDIELGSVISYATEPAVIGPIATAVTDINEIHVFHPGSDLEINPSEIVISGGSVTISIPRCRLKLESVLDQTVDYTDNASFETTVDVKRIYTDSTTQATLICSKCASCTTKEISGCLRVMNQRMGTIEFNSNNITCTCGCLPERIGFNYYAGDINVTEKARDVVVRLAHAKMPEQECGCDFALRLWQRDREIPEILTKDNITPFGISRGSQVAWEFVKAMKLFSFGGM